VKTATLSPGLAWISLCIASLLPPSLVRAGDDDLFAEGARVFSTVAGVGCTTCHGEYAEGDLGVGPYIRGATEGSIRAAIDATNEMVIVKNAITDAEIKAVSAYLGHLGTMQVVRTLAKRGRFLPDDVHVRPGTSVQLIIRNAGTEPHTFKSDDMGIEALTVPGRSTGSIQWQAPESEGDYSLYCTDCKLKGQFLTVRVDMDAAEFRTTAPTNKGAADGTM